MANAQSSWTRFVLFLAATSLAGTLRAAPPDPENEAASNRKYWLDACAKHADDYRISPTHEPDHVLKRVEKPIFGHTKRQSDKNRASQIGLVFLWTDHAGRPAVVATVLANSLRSHGQPGYYRLAHVLQSLSTTPLTAQWRDADLWTPTEPGIEWHPIPDAPIPGKSAASRLRQARTLTRKFQSHSIDERGGRWELRVVSKPLYSYAVQPADSGLGGAVFAFCEGTDPEVLLALESRPTKDGPCWHLAFAAFSNYELHGSLEGNEVWTVGKRGSPPNTSPRWAKRDMEILAGPDS